jgi:hypothetical protein
MANFNKVPCGGEYMYLANCDLACDSCVDDYGGGFVPC